MKIKKTVQPRIQDLPKLNIKYTLVVPLMGIVDILTMGSFFMNSATDGNLAAKAFFVVCGFIGAGFTYWGLMWKLTVDGKKIRIRSAFGAVKELPFSDLNKVVVHRKKNGSFSYYELFDVRGDSIVKVYPLMKDSSVLLDRTKRLGIRTEEKRDQ